MQMIAHETVTEQFDRKHQRGQSQSVHPMHVIFIRPENQLLLQMFHSELEHAFASVVRVSEITPFHILQLSDGKLQRRAVHPKSVLSHGTLGTLYFITY